MKIKQLAENANVSLLIKSFSLTIFYLLGIFITISLFNFYPFKDASFLNVNNLLTLFFRWDSLHYQQIAINGYDKINSVFFPLYPILVRVLSYITGPLWSGFLISWIFLALSIFIFYKILELKYDDERSRQKTIALLLFSPFALFFTAFYTESLFLFLLLFFFYSLQKKKWLTASLIAFLACLTKNIGIFLLPVYLFEYWQNYKHKTGGLDINKRLYNSFIILLAPAIYGIFCYLKFGNPISFITEQSNWTSHAFMFPWVSLKKYYLFLTKDYLGNYYALYQIFFKEIGAFIILLITAIYLWIKHEWSYAIFGSLMALLFLCMTPMTSVNRYVIIFFPLYTSLNGIFKKDLNWFILFFLSFIYFVFNLYIFSHGAWVG